MKESDLQKAERKLLQQKQVLEKTTKLTTKLLKDSLWAEIDEYYKHEDNIWRHVGTILNACITHQKIVFCITRDHFRRISRNDKNKTGGLANGDWKKILAYLQTLGCKRLRHGKIGQASVFSILDLNLGKVIIDQFSLDIKDQESEAFKFYDRVSIFQSNDESDKSEKTQLSSTKKYQACDSDSNCMRWLKSKVTYLMSRNEWCDKKECFKKAKDRSIPDNIVADRIKKYNPSTKREKRLFLELHRLESFRGFEAHFS